MKNIKLIDCTFRDGGYYNKWDFDFDLVETVMRGLDSSGVDIIEVGYKSVKKDGFFGLFRYCPESQLTFLQKFKNLSYAVMLDVKEFIRDNTLDKELVLNELKPARDSIFDWCRLATYHNTIPQACELASFLKELGYKVSLNYMGVSLIEESDFIEAVQMVNDSESDVLCFADSFGSFLPEDIKQKIEIIRKHFTKDIGFHAHDNQGLAYANVLSAIHAGIDYIDATITGMGRGAGNLKLEQILMYLFHNYNADHLNPYSLLDCVEKYFHPLREKFGWGWDISYMLSGIENIHPSYCQMMRNSHQYTMAQITQILKTIPINDRSSFNHDTMIEVSELILKNKIITSNDLEKVYKPLKYDTILIAANGPSLRKYRHAIKEFIRKENPLVLECNNTGHLSDVDRNVVVLNQVRLQEFFNNADLSKVNSMITGLSRVDETYRMDCIEHYPYEMVPNTFESNNKRIIIPSFLVGMYAIGLALLSNPSYIYLAGFDGFEGIKDVKKRQEDIDMSNFFADLIQTADAKECSIYSILPTSYSLVQKSIFSFL